MTQGSEPDWLRDILGLHVDDERRGTVIAAYRDILRELEKLRALDLTDVHPAVVFSPLAHVASSEPALPPLIGTKGRAEK